jgi:hypothetical protein
MVKGKNIQKKSDKTVSKSTPKEKKAAKAKKRAEKKENDS